MTRSPIATADPSSGTPPSGRAAGRERRVDWVDLCLRSKPLIAAVNGICHRRRRHPDPLLRRDPRLRPGALRHRVHQDRAGARARGDALPHPAHGTGASRGCSRSAATCGPRTKRCRRASSTGSRSTTTWSTKRSSWPRRIAANPAPQLQWTKQLLIDNALETDLARRAGAGDGGDRPLLRVTRARRRRSGVHREAAAADSRLGPQSLEPPGPYSWGDASTPGAPIPRRSPDATSEDKYGPHARGALHGGLRRRHGRHECRRRQDREDVGEGGDGPRRRRGARRHGGQDALHADRRQWRRRRVHRTVHLGVAGRNGVGHRER